MVAPGYNVGGWRPLEQTRLKSGWFRTVPQRLWEARDGRREWRNERLMSLPIDVHRSHKAEQAVTS